METLELRVGQNVEKEGDPNCKHAHVRYVVDRGTEHYACDHCGRMETFRYPSPGNRSKRLQFPVGALVRPYGGLSGELMLFNDCVYRWKANAEGKLEIVPEEETEECKATGRGLVFVRQHPRTLASLLKRFL